MTSDERAEQRSKRCLKKRVVEMLKILEIIENNGLSVGKVY